MDDANRDGKAFLGSPPIAGGSKLTALIPIARWSAPLAEQRIDEVELAAAAFLARYKGWESGCR